MTQGFIEMDVCDMEYVNGGANTVQVIGGAAGIAVACWAPVAVAAGAPFVAAGMVLVGVGAVINMAS